MHRFFLRTPAGVGSVVALTESDSHHAARVLRLGRGETVEILDGAGRCLEAEVVETGKRSASVRILSEKSISAPPRVELAAFARTRKGEDVWQSSLKVPQKHIAGTAGAGDAFAAGVLLGLHEGWELARCLLTGICVAAASLSEPSCTAGVKPLAVCQTLAKKYGVRASLEPSD